MSGWQLGLALFGCLLAGWVAGLVSVYTYARHVWRSKMGALAGQLIGSQQPPPPRSDSYDPMHP
jgi:ABC-type xylose transport system permease subunit